jgi:hypothetical protein
VWLAAGAEGVFGGWGGGSAGGVGEGAFGEPEDEGATDAEFGVQCDGAAVGLGDLADDGEAEASAALAGGRDSGRRLALAGAEEAVEDPVGVFCGDARAFVAYGDPRLPTASTSSLPPRASLTAFESRLSTARRSADASPAAIGPGDRRRTT